MNARLRATVAAAAAAALLCAAALVTSSSGAERPGGDAFRLGSARITPGTPLFAGKRKIRLHYRFEARRSLDLRIIVVRVRSGNVIRAYTERGVEPGKAHTRVWDGLTRRGKAAPDGRYELRVGPLRGRDRYAARLKLHGHAFPVDGPHGTRGAVGEFHAPRNGGRTHGGFDVTGACGTPLLAARGGVVKKTSYDPVLYGNYVLIDAAKSRQDYFYAHMIAPSKASKGERVFTGEQLGRIGQTGNAASTPCHLHFEIRVHGRPIDPEPKLLSWDRYS